MSYPYSGSAFDHYEFHVELPASRINFPPHAVEATDRAIDVALRSVPLPSGLLARLGKLVYSLPEEATDQLDFLGC